MKSKFEKELKKAAYSAVPDKWNELRSFLPESGNKPAEKSISKNIKIVLCSAAALVLVLTAVTLMSKFRTSELPKAGGSTSVFISRESEECTEAANGYSAENSTEIFETESPRPKISKENSAKKTSRSDEAAGKIKENITISTVYEKTTTALSTTVREFYSEKDWKDKNITEKFRCFIFEGSEYVWTGNNLNRSGKLLQKKKITCTDPASLKEYSTDIWIYEPDKMSKKVVLGVKFSEDDIFHCYVNMGWQPSTLGEFLSSIDYESTLSYGVMPPLNVPLIAKDANKYLYSEKGAKNIVKDTYGEGDEPSGRKTTVSISCAELNMMNKALTLYDSGYISANLIGYRMTFFIGKENMDAFRKNVYDFAAGTTTARNYTPNGTETTTLGYNPE